MKLPWLQSVLSSGSDITIVLSVSGDISSVQINDTMEGSVNPDAWQGRNIRHFLAEDSQIKIDRVLNDFTDHTTDIEIHTNVELNHCDQDGPMFPVQYSFQRLDEDRTILMVGRDLRPVGEAQQKLIKAQLTWEREAAKARAISQKLRILMDRTSQAACFVDAKTGNVIEASSAFAKVVNLPIKDIEEKSLASALSQTNKAEFLRQVQDLASARDETGLELSLPRKDAPVTLYAEMHRGIVDTVFYCWLDTDNSQDALAAKSRWPGFVHASPDPIFICDSSGKLLEMNEGFLNFTEATNQATVQGAPIVNFLARGSVDWTLIKDACEEFGILRRFNTELVGLFGGSIAVELDILRYSNTSDVYYGVLAREAQPQITADASSRTPQTEDEIKEVLGQATLKQIVAETTDVIEKQCIKAALEMTRNNRVAAAEMLGLSRQSLYVKLRKFDLLDKGE